MQMVVEYISNNTKTWLQLLGFPNYKETVNGKDIIREIAMDEKNFTIHYKILWSFESNSQAQESLQHWYNEFENYKRNHK